jgi:septum formation protein
MPTSAHQLVLASGSPRRQKLLAELGVAYTVDVADIDETPLKDEEPLTYVRRVALAKVAAVAARHPGKIILGADTTVTLGRRILGKPVDTADAKRMVELMAGRRHRVLTTVAVVMADGQIREKTTNTTVKIRPLTPGMVQSYIADPANWQGLAGAYGIQTAIGGALVQSINGSASGVVGLPLVETVNLLRSAGLDV